MNAIEKTLIILKPDCMEKQLGGVVLDRFLKDGFTVVGCKFVQLVNELVKEHYSHIADKPFFPEVAGFMASKPVLVLILKGERVIERVRSLLGPTDSTAAPKGTIRGDWGIDKMRNIAHASDSLEAAEAEIKRFFKAEEVLG
jgi:nucleoside-diphosphate kinase